MKYAALLLLFMLAACAPPGNTVCVPAQAHAPLPAATFEDFPSAILNYLNEGGTPQELAGEMAVLQGGDQNPVTWGDLTGDGKDDVVVSLMDPVSDTFMPRGTLLVYNCQTETYTLAFDLAPESTNFALPAIYSMQDLNADGISEVLFATSTCGAHTCFEQVQILRWDGADYVYSLEGASDDLPYPEISAGDADEDGCYEVEVTGTGFGSVGAGPYRPRTRIWHYDAASGHWLVSTEVLADPVYRIHLLHDADSAFRSEDYEMAIRLYQQVISVAGLSDWVEPVVEQANLGAYARFKLIVIYTLTGQPEEAQRVLAELQDGLAVGNWQDFTSLAEAYLDGVAVAGQGCPAARRYAETHSDQILAPLGSMAFGYANPDYTPQDICP